MIIIVKIKVLLKSTPPKKKNSEPIAIEKSDSKL